MVTASTANSDLKASELARFARNLENFSKTNLGEALYYRFHGILESQIVTLQCCGVITRNGALKLHEQMGLIIRSKASAPSGNGGEDATHS